MHHYLLMNDAAQTERVPAGHVDGEINLATLDMLAIIGGSYKGLTFAAPRVPTFEEEV